MKISFFIPALFVVSFFFAGKMNLFSQTNDSLVYSVKDKKIQYQVFKNMDDQSYYIIDQINSENKIKYKDLKFALPVGENTLQVIDKNNKMFFLDEKLNKKDTVDVRPLGRHYFCGNESWCFFSVKETKDNFIVIKEEGWAKERIEKQTHVDVVEVSKLKADQVFFYNKKQQLSLVQTQFFYSPVTIFFIKEGKYGVIGKYEFMKGFVYDDLEILYDALEILDPKLYMVKKGELFGYYGITKIKYKSLNKFNYLLAQFELPEGTKGFVDFSGKEYFEN